MNQCGVLKIVILTLSVISPNFIFGCEYTPPAKLFGEEGDVPTYDLGYAESEDTPRLLKLVAKGDLHEVEAYILSVPTSLTEKTSGGWNALHVAIDMCPENWQLACLLIRYGIDPNAPIFCKGSDYHLWTPLHLAVNSNALDTIKLLACCCKVDIDAMTAMHQTPTDFAVFNGRDDIVDFFERRKIENKINLTKQARQKLRLSCDF